MPIVKTEKMKYQSQDGKFKDYVMKVHLDPRSGPFYINPPEEVMELMGVKTVSATKMVEVLKKFNELMVEFYKQSIRVRKIIAYKINISATIYSYGDNGDVIECLLNRNDVPFCKGKGLQIEWGIYEERTYGFHVSYAKKCSDGTSYVIHDIGGRKIIDWTEQRESFFRSIDKCMDELLLRIHRQIDVQQEDLANLIDSGNGNFLLTGGK
jgi:hypothetical protein